MIPSVDLIVVGGGLAGLSAAVRASELGLSVLVLEQGDGEAYPCNSRQSGGIVHIAFHDPFRPTHELVGVIDRVTLKEARPALALALAQTGHRLIDWLQAKGARFMRFNPQEGYRWCMAPPRALKAGSDWEQRGPDMVLRQLVTHLETAGGHIRRATTVTGLVMEGGRCTGVTAEHRGETLTYPARFVLLADGGFQANKDLYQSHIGGSFDAVFQRGPSTGRGAGLLMAQQAGAAVTGTDRFYGHLLCADARHNDQVWPYPELDAIATAGLVVNQTGVRVADEGRGGVYLANMLAREPEGSRFFAIFDAAIWEGPGTSARIPANPLLEKAGGTIHRAATLDELAQQIGVPADALVHSIAAYHSALDQDRLAQLPVARSTKIPPLPIRSGPFMAIAVLPGITYTMGGIMIDEHAQVLDDRGAVIPGLLAAGATTGGLEGGSQAAYLGGLIKAGSFGLIAAERVAALLKPASDHAEDSVAAPSAPMQPLHGLARFPVLKATLKYGRFSAFGLGVLVAGLVLWLGWPSFGLFSPVLAAGAGALTTVAVLSYVELIRLITELLMPD